MFSINKNIFLNLRTPKHKNMNYTNTKYIFSILIFVFIFTNSCKKEDNVAKTVKDIDGNVYKTVKIGTQTWMAENLKVTKYRNGDFIGTTNPATLDISQETEPKYQWAFEGNNSNVFTYGRLYSWYAVNDVRNISPIGWHIPTMLEIETLIDYLGGKEIAGGKLKETGFMHWRTPNDGATNETGFTGIPSGGRRNNGNFNYLGLEMYMWTKTEADTTNAWCFFTSFNLTSLNLRDDLAKNYGFAIRCIKD